MKKLTVGILGMVAILISAFGLVLTITHDEVDAKSKVMGIMLDDVGYVVLDTDGNVVACKVKTVFKNGDATCTNVFDSKDTIYLDKTNYKNPMKEGDILRVEFEGDIVVKVVKNKRNIANKYIGQKLNKKVYVDAGRISNVYEKTVNFKPFSKKNLEVTLVKKNLSFKPKKNDAVIVTIERTDKDSNKPAKFTVKKLKQIK